VVSKTRQRIQQSYWMIVSLIAGAVSTLAFAPFNQGWLLFLCLALALYQWDKLPAKQAAISGWLFAMGLQCTGVSWIYYSVHVHGSAPAFFAVLLVVLLCCYLSVYTALSVYLVNRFLPATPMLRIMLAYPASWVVFEWLQGYVMTGFAWMQLGYSQIDLPLSGFAPLLGNHAVSGLVVFSSTVLVVLFKQWQQTDKIKLLPVLLAGTLLWVCGGLLKTIHWTDKSGDPVRISVIQGNIQQQDKWKPAMRLPTMKLYRDLSLAQKDVDLIIWPETAIPDYRHRVLPYLQQLSEVMQKRGTDLLLGIFVLNEENRVVNSVVNINGGIYNKIHLVPLGEYIPLRFLIEFFNRFVKIPMSDIDSGNEDQPLLVAAGQPLGMSICFEDAFARDVIKHLPEARLLVNVSNDAWFENSHEPHQHHAIARMRALETGRYMIRSTNTGITAVIGPHGEVLEQLPQFETGVLNTEVQPLAGATPFVRWGDWLIVVLCGLLLLGYKVLNSRHDRAG
jgi:apolipoprotein N-acyltransferase